MPITAALAANALPRATIAPERAARATLQPTEQVVYPLAPGHTPAPGTHGGLFAVTIVRAGTYRVALDSGAWIDLVKNGQAIASSAHGHGPVCSSIRKVVDFPLLPGRYVLQLSGAAPAVELMVVPVAD